VAYNSGVRIQPLPLAACALLALGAGPPRQEPQTFRSGVSAIPIYVTVRSQSGALVPDLTREDFEIRDNGVRRDVTVFSRDIVPITVTMMLDMSGSQETGAEWMREAGRAFVDALLPADRARIGTFGWEIAISPRMTGEKRYLHRVLTEEVWPGGGTPLWDALDRAMTSLGDEPGRRVILVLTDGVDSGTAARGMFFRSTGVPTASGRPSIERLGPPSTLLERSTRDGFMVYAVGRRLPPGRVPTEALSQHIRDLAFDSGGGYRIFSESQEAKTAMIQVAEELHHQYFLGFIPSVMDGKLHKLQVTTRLGGMSVQARKSYLAVAR
jgi:VWFA-related protein